MILETERLTLSPLAAADGPLVHPIMADPEVMAHWDVGEIDDPDVVDQMLAGQMDAMADERAFYWAMRLTGDGTFLGLCDLSDIDRRHHRAEVGFILGKDSWGRGYAYEAMQAVMNFAATQGMQRLWARTHVGNEASEKLLTKLGFEQEGYMRGHVDRDGERRDVRLWGLLL
ncbi:MAG: N-acetyltransferase [Caulobacteraceae bacterium]|nr:GNAT family N-acetyltransferase [Caulobacter sp.]RYF89569.1 MAG: N-acetyltransferase [Caulobacteraceae bacterium]